MCDYELALDRESRGAGPRDQTVGPYFRVLVGHRGPDGAWSAWATKDADPKKRIFSLPAVVITKEDAEWARAEGRAGVSAVAASRWVSRYLQFIVLFQRWTLAYPSLSTSPGFGEEVV